MSVTDLQVPPFIALGIPCGRNVIEFATARDLWAIGRTYRGRQALIHGDSSMVMKSRNLLVEGALKVKAEWLLMLDSDMRFPQDTITRLLAHDKDIVGAIYPRRTAPYEMLGTALSGPGDYAGLVEMENLGAGVLMIRMSVFEKFTRPFFRCPADEESGETIGEDIHFCRTARALGFQVWCDIELSKEVGHIGTMTVWPDEQGQPRIAINA